MQLVALPRWIFKQENLRFKKHASIVVALESKSQMEEALRKKMRIAGEFLKTEEYQEFRTDEQYNKCQGFGHKQYFCKKKPRCKICAKNHLTRMHNCDICKINGKPCIHADIKCTNCQGNHMINAKECEFH